MDARARPATPNDLDAVRGVFRRAALHWDDDRAWLLANPHHLEWDGGALDRTLVADDGRAVLGFGGGVPREGVFEVEDLFVDPPAMGRGVGRILVAALADRARALGLPALEVTGNPRALGFYEAVGFRVIGEAATERILAPRLRRPVGT